MRIIDWNISYSNAPAPKIELLKKIIGDDSYVAVLQEVTPSQHEAIKEQFPNMRYSLDYRKPGKFDSKQRQLGVVILCSEDVTFKEADVLARCLLPDRTLVADLEYKGESLRVIGLHSITGISHKKAKSMQFRSFAECVDELKPDIVAFDANEPAKDHYDIEEMEFFDNQDQGKGAEMFFKTLRDTGLRDAFVDGYDKNKYIEGEPLITSHRFESSKKSKRYDFVFVGKEISIARADYLYDEAVEAGGDHAVIVCQMK